MNDDEGRMVLTIFVSVLYPYLSLVRISLVYGYSIRLGSYLALP